MSSIPHSEWKWFGDPGHFICGRWCRFHLCTLIGKYLVSTVGAYVHPARSGGKEKIEAEWLKDNWPGEDIGFGRKYETMVFLAGEPCSQEGCNCGLPQISGGELDLRGANTPGEATAYHMELCAEVATEAFQARQLEPETSLSDA